MQTHGNKTDAGTQAPVGERAMFPLAGGSCRYDKLQRNWLGGRSCPLDRTRPSIWMAHWLDARREKGEPV